MRIFSVAALHPEAVSACVLRGTAHQDTYFVMELEDGLLRCSHEGIKGHPLTPIRLSVETVRENWELGAKQLDRMLRSKKLNGFEELVLNAALMYSRCTIAKTIADKLTYILAALESVFIKNNTEPVQSNLSERMAFALVQDPDERAEVIRTVKDTYGLRSQFLHHGQSIDDLALMERFMNYAWHTILGLIRTTDDYSDREELLKELEHRKLS